MSEKEEEESLKLRASNGPKRMGKRKKESLEKLIKDETGWESEKTSLREFLKDESEWKRGKTSLRYESLLTLEKITCFCPYNGAGVP